MFFAWLRRWPIEWVRSACAALQRRSALDRNTFKVIQKLTWETVESSDEAVWSDWSYWKSLWKVIVGGR